MFGRRGVTVWRMDQDTAGFGGGELNPVEDFGGAWYRIMYEDIGV